MITLSGRRADSEKVYKWLKQEVALYLEQFFFCIVPQKFSLRENSCQFTA